METAGLIVYKTLYAIFTGVILYSGGWERVELGSERLVLHYPAELYEVSLELASPFLLRDRHLDTRENQLLLFLVEPAEYQRISCGESPALASGILFSKILKKENRSADVFLSSRLKKFEEFSLSFEKLKGVPEEDITFPHYVVLPYSPAEIEKLLTEPCPASYGSVPGEEDRFLFQNTDYLQTDYEKKQTDYKEKLYHTLKQCERNYGYAESLNEVRETDSIHCSTRRAGSKDVAFIMRDSSSIYGSTYLFYENYMNFAFISYRLTPFSGLEGRCFLTGIKADLLLKKNEYILELWFEASRREEIEMARNAVREMLRRMKILNEK